MSNVWSTVQEKEVGLRKMLLTKIFLRTLTHDKDDDFYNEPSANETPSQETLQLPYPLKINDEPLTVPEIEEQNIMEAEVQNEILQENSYTECSEPFEKKLRMSYDKDDGILSYTKYNGDEQLTSVSNLLDSQDTSSSARINQASVEMKVEFMRTHYAALNTKKPKKSERRALKKYSKILELIEVLERKIAEFCDKENDTPTDVSESPRAYDIPRLQYIGSYSQKERYEKYQSKTSKACKQLEAEISLYSQYIETLETAMASIPEDTEIYKVLQAKVKKAHKFHRENPLHKEVNELNRQCKLIGVLLKKFRPFF